MYTAHMKIHKCNKNTLTAQKKLTYALQVHPHCIYIHIEYTVNVHRKFHSPYTPLIINSAYEYTHKKNSNSKFSIINESRNNIYDTNILCNWKFGDTLFYFFNLNYLLQIFK